MLKLLFKLTMLPPTVLMKSLKMTLIKGPPGMGKTETASAMAVCVRRLSFNILAQVGSNAAADVLASKIMEPFIVFELRLEGVYRVECQLTEIYMGASGFTDGKQFSHLTASIRRNLEMLVAQGPKHPKRSWTP
jgi:hypothetical protein